MTASMIRAEGVSKKYRIGALVATYTTLRESIMAVAKAHNLYVVEDAAPSAGAEFNGQRTGSFGHFGCFSFHPSKNLSAAGDGGAVVARNAELDEALRRQRELGQVGQNNHVVVGFNTKLDALQARILSWKLPHLER